MAETVTAQVILRSPAGTSVLDTQEAITAENVAKYRVGKEVIAEATKKLEGLGFQVLQAGPTNLTISGNKALFERIFQTSLEAQSTEVMGTKTSGAEAAYYRATEPIKVPDELSSQVAAVALPTPPKFFP
jgi:hypothetical protein